MPGIFEALRGQIAKRQLAADDQVLEAARAAAADLAVDAVALEAAMFSSGTTLDQFEQLVELCRKRAGWLADLDGMKAAGSRQAKAEAALKAETDRFEEARRIALDKIAKLEREAAEARAAYDRAKAGRDNLLDPRNVPGGIGERYRATLDERDQAEGEVRRLRNAITRMRDEERAATQTIEELTKQDANTIKPDRVMYRNDRAAWEDQTAKKLAEWQGKLDFATKQIRSLETQLTKAEAALVAAEKAVGVVTTEVLRA